MNPHHSLLKRDFAQIILSVLFCFAPFFLSAQTAESGNPGIFTQSGVIIPIFYRIFQQPIASFKSPINFELETRKLVDGEHYLRVVSKDPSGREVLRKIPLVVRNGPDISVEGIKANEIVDGVLPIMVSAYGKGDQKLFLIEGSETPRSIPNWVWLLHIVFGGWAIYYLITNLFIS